MILARVLWGVLVGVGLLDLVLIAPALWVSRATQTTGRLLSSLLFITGLVISSGDRVVHPVHAPAVVLAGLALTDAGLLGFAFFLPERGLLARMQARGSRWVRRERDGDGAA